MQRLIVLLSIVCKPASNEKNLVPPVTYLRPLWWTFKNESLFNVKKTKFKKTKLIKYLSFQVIIVVWWLCRQEGMTQSVILLSLLLYISMQIGRNFNTKDWTTKLIWLFSTCLKNYWFEMFHLLFSYFLLAAALDFWSDRFSTMS